MFLFNFWKKRKIQPVNTPQPDSAAEKPQQLSSPPKESARNRCSFSGSVVSDVGSVRDNNEDNYILQNHINADSANHSTFSTLSDDDSPWQVAAVFDGMGGGEQGERASLLSAQLFVDILSGLGEEPTAQKIDSVFKSTLQAANNQIVDWQQESNIFGTTGTVLCTDCAVLKFYHLGDSRAYLFRDGHLMQLTRDQTLAQMKVDAGFYDNTSPEFEADKHKLTEYIGRDQTRENLRPMETAWFSIQQGDRFLLCSDGLYDMCSDAEIEQILQQPGDAEMQAKQLAEAACRNGGEDNVTCMVLVFS